MVDQGIVGRPVEDVVLEQILACGHVTVEQICAAVVRFSVVDKVVIDPDIGKADLTHLLL